MSLLDRFRSSPATDADGVRGTAQVVTVSVHHGDTVNQICEMHLVISASGVAPLAVEFSGTVKRKAMYTPTPPPAPPSCDALPGPPAPSTRKHSPSMTSRH